MDNFKINLVSEGKRDLLLAMQIAFRHEKDHVVAYRICKDKGLIFYKFPATSPGVVVLPFTLDSAGAADFASRWLAETFYGEEPDHDGDNGKGWRLYNEDWGNVGGEFEAFVAIKPAWAMYGK